MSRPPNKPTSKDLDRIFAPPPIEAGSDAAHQAELRDLELQKKKLKLEESRGNLGDRQKYARKIYFIVAAWIVAIFFLIVLQGFGQYTHFKLSDSVLLAAIGSTTANVIGMLLIVLRYLFPNDKPKR